MKLSEAIKKTKEEKPNNLKFTQNTFFSRSYPIKYDENGNPDGSCSVCIITAASLATENWSWWDKRDLSLVDWSNYTLETFPILNTRLINFNKNILKTDKDLIVNLAKEKRWRNLMFCSLFMILVGLWDAEMDIDCIIRIAEAAELAELEASDE